MDTQQIIYNMITENTGRSILDSGDYYGRHFEENQKHSLADFVASPKFAAKFSNSNGGLDVEVSKFLFHHLSDNLVYDEGMDTRWLDFAEQFPEETWKNLMSRFYDAAKRDEENGWEFEGQSFGGYTYGEDNVLSQDFVYNVMGEWVFIQTHNGCDARGGFSTPHIFRYDDGLMSYNDFTVGCENGHWHDFQGTYENTEQEYNLNEYECVNFEDLEGDELEKITENNRWLADQDVLPGFEKPEYVAFIGKIVIKDGKPLCPICGKELSV